jgi:hypothetical protein
MNASLNPVMDMLRSELAERERQELRVTALLSEIDAEIEAGERQDDADWLAGFHADVRALVHRCTSQNVPACLRSRVAAFRQDLKQGAAEIARGMGA